MLPRSAKPSAWSRSHWPSAATSPARRTDAPGVRRSLPFASSNWIAGWSRPARSTMPCWNSSISWAHASTPSSRRPAPFPDVSHSAAWAAPRRRGHLTGQWPRSLYSPVPVPRHPTSRRLPYSEWSPPE